MTRATKKKAELSVNVIVMMVIALIVLAVLLYLTYQYVFKPGEQAGAVGTCAGQGGTCKASCEGTERGLVGLGCPSGQRCCVTIT